VYGYIGGGTLLGFPLASYRIISRAILTQDEHERCGLHVYSSRSTFGFGKLLCNLRVTEGYPRNFYSPEGYQEYKIHIYIATQSVHSIS